MYCHYFQPWSCTGSYQIVSVAQWIARRTSNPEVVGSSPTRDGKFFVEFLLLFL